MRIKKFSQFSINENIDEEMKYIRKYNENKVDFLSITEIDKFEESHQFENFSKSELDVLLKYNRSILRNGHTITIGNTKIRKYTDEWYIANITNDTRYYKCDQISGLIEFISDRVKNIINY